MSSLPAEGTRPLDAAEGPALRLEDVEVTYQRGSVEVRAVRGVTLEVAAGDFVAIEGPSGSGKSTLLRVMAGLWPPSAGRVLLAGEDLTRRSDADLARIRRREIGFVHQLFNLLPDLSAADNVALPLLLDGLPSDQIATRVNLALAQLGIADKGNRRPEELSGGEMLRVALARALVIDPVLILADEPTGSLDRDNSRRVIDIFREVHAARGVTIILVTHDPEVAQRATRRIRLVDGRLVEVGAGAGGEERLGAR
jgi:putative ABC transport system ATP-binding protein